MVAIGLIWFFGISKEGAAPTSSPDSTPSTSSGQASSPQASPTATKPTVSQSPDVLNKYPPAECQLTGSITFISPRLYENKDANIIYKNIDSVARHIIWTISPNDDLAVGPNLFANLPLPDGVEDVTVSLPDNPKSKNYILTAKVTYEVFINRNLEIKESSCTGQIPIKINY